MCKKIKNNLIIFFSTNLFLFLILLGNGSANAEVLPVTGQPSVTTGKYNPLAGIPGLVSGGSFDDYINSLYALSIAIAGLLAVVKIIIAGVKWMTSDIVTSRIEAKKDIQGAVFGLLVVLGAVIILNTINPKLTETDVTLTSIAVDVKDTVTTDVNFSDTEITVGSSKIYAIKIDSDNKVKRAFTNYCISDKGGIVRSGIVSGSNVEIGPRCVVGDAEPVFETENNKSTRNVCADDVFVNKVIWCSRGVSLKK